MSGLTAAGQQLANGIALGSLYALLACGVAVVFGVAKVPDFSLGQKAMLGGYVVYFGTTTFHLNFWVALAIAIVVLGAFGMVLGRLVFWPLRGQTINGFIAALGIGVALESIALLLWSFNYRTIRAPGYFGSVVTLPLGVRTTGQLVIILAVAVVVTLLLAIFFQGTTLGRSIRAVAGNEVGARLSGINIEFVVVVAMGLGSALAAVAGALGGLVVLVYPEMGNQLILVAFAAVVAGGFSDVRAALAAGFILGISESLGSVLISPAFQSAYPFIIVVIILILRPTGLISRAAVVGQRLSHEM